MFVREIKKPNGSKSIQIVESIREGKKVKQKVIRHMGQWKFEHEIEQVKKTAEEIIISIKNELNPVLPIIDPKDFYSRPAKKKIEEDVCLSNLRAEKRKIEGVYEVLGNEYQQLRFDSIINGTRKDGQWNEMLKLCTLARISSPKSKKKTAQELSLDYDLDIPLEKIYRMMDHLANSEEILKKKVTQSTLKLFKEEVDILFYDVTTLYFESFEEDELRSFGFSKDCKFKETQIVLALITNNEGFPISYEIFPGNTFEGKTLLTSIDSLKNRFDVKNIFLAADRGMFGRENLLKLESVGIKYVVSAPLKKLKSEIKRKILTEDFSPGVVSNELHWIKEYSYEKKRLIVSYSGKRARKDQKERERQVERLLSKAKDGKVKMKELIKNNGNKKFIRVVKDEAKINYEKIEEDSRWDGLHGVISNHSEKTAIELLEKYRGLWNIEAAFRVNKHDLKMRPIFHWKPNRIKAHIGICYLAYALICHVKKRLKNSGLEISLEEIKEELQRVYSVIVKDRTTQKYYGIPSKMNDTQRKIYKIFKLSRSTVPYSLNQQ